MCRSGGCFDLEGKRIEQERLSAKTTEADFWSNPDNARKLTKRISNLTRPIEKYDRLSGELNDLSELSNMIEDHNSDDWAEILSEIERIDAEITGWEFDRMMSGPDDRGNAIVTIHAGAGGTESADWVAMLLRMYLRYTERRGFDHDVIDLQPGETAGIKSVSVEVDGEYSYGRLKSESGVHRLVRISPFDSSNRRHTSFASVFVFPVLEDTGKIVINPADLRIDTFRASGAGGQHVNKTDSAVRMTHIPTGIVATCQSERSQHRNREAAKRFLMAKLLRRQREEETKERDALEATKMANAWGSQIRNYVLHPYQMVKDVRTSVETSNTEAVLDGDLDQFIEAFLMSDG